MKSIIWLLLSAVLLIALLGCTGRDDRNDISFTIVGFNLPPAPQPDLSGADHVFHVAALEVQLPLQQGPINSINAVNFEWRPPQATLKVGNIVRWVSKQGFHGVTFTNWPQTQQILQIEDGLEIKPQPRHGADAQGTDGASAGTLLVQGKIVDIPAGLTEIPFICTVHGDGMSGKLILETGEGEPRIDVPILAYVPLVTETEEELAAEITELTRTLDTRVDNAVSERINQALSDDASLPNDDDGRHALEMQFRPEEIRRLETPIEERIKRLRDSLQARFRDRPEPLVLRVAAPAAGEAAVEVGVKLINLLPSKWEIEARESGGNNSPFGPVWSPITSLHASLVRYDVQQSHGSGAGMNSHSMCVRGDTRNYLWSIDRVLGICRLGDMADPEHQTMGLFGALIVERPGSIIQNATAEQDNEVPPGWQAIIRPSGSNAFREFVIFVHDNFIGSRATGKFAVNYYSAADSVGNQPLTPVMQVHAGDRVVVRQVHAAGEGAMNNHSFFIGGRRWPFDISDDRSNHVAAIAEAPWSACNIRFDADLNVVKMRSYLYGSHVGNQITNGEWGLLQVLKPGDNQILPLP